MRSRSSNRFFATFILALLFTPLSADEIDVDTLLGAIDERASQYEQLIAVLQGSDATRSLAAFDVMIETGDKTLRETAISAALTATDERLRARALWETLVAKDSVTVQIATDDLSDDQKTALDDWIGEISTWPITARFPETQCLNLFNTNNCNLEYNISVSGVQIDMRYKSRLQGRLVLNAEGSLSGTLSDPGTNDVFPATIQLR